VHWTWAQTASSTSTLAFDGHPMGYIVKLSLERARHGNGGAGQLVKCSIGRTSAVRIPLFCKWHRGDSIVARCHRWRKKHCIFSTSGMMTATKPTELKDRVLHSWVSRGPTPSFIAHCDLIQMPCKPISQNPAGQGHRTCQYSTAE
jgi:hypothetical protein